MMFLNSAYRKKIKKLLPANLIVQKLPSSRMNSVLLTFDDGPHTQITPKVLALIGAYGARAIFFTVGRRIEKAPEVLKMIKNQGHLVGNHSYIHSNAKQPWFVNYWRDLKQCQNLIEKQIGQEPKIFRPPGGRISLTSLIVSKLLDLRIILWSLDGGDWNCQTIETAKQIGNYLIEKIEPGDIVLLHDDNPHVLIILDMLLPAIQSRGIDLHSAVELYKHQDRMKKIVTMHLG